MTEARKKRVRCSVYVSLNQLSPDCFKTTFEQCELTYYDRWVAHLIPRNEECHYCLNPVGLNKYGSSRFSPWLVIGSIIIIHFCNPDDRKTVKQISDNILAESCSVHRRAIFLTEFAIHEKISCTTEIKAGEPDRVNIKPMPEFFQQALILL